MGELRRRGRVWWLRYYRAGKRYEESSGSQKKQVAIALLKVREGDGVKGLPITPQINRLTFDDAVADVVTDYKTNGKKSLEDLERRITLHLKPYFTGRRMVSINTSHLRAYVGSRQAPVTNDDGTESPGASNAQINRELAIIRRAFRLAVQAGKLLHVPHIPMLREDNVRKGFFETDQFLDVRKALPKPLRPVVTFVFYTGWRLKSEVLGLLWAQVDRHAKVVRLDVGGTKSGEGRTLPYALVPELCSVVEEQWREHERLKKKGRIVPHVFHRDGAPILSMRKAFATACETAGVVKVPHDFRRTAVRNLVRAGVPEKTAMMITGHKTRSVFDRYDIVNEADIRDGLGRLASASGTKKGQSGKSGRVTSIASRQTRKVS